MSNNITIRVGDKEKTVRVVKVSLPENVYLMGQQMASGMGMRFFDWVVGLIIREATAAGLWMEKDSLYLPNGMALRAPDYGTGNQE